MDSQPFSPNTAAFLNYLDSQFTDENSAPSLNDPSLLDPSLAKPQQQPVQQSMPPSALFPVPGRDTPEDTPSSNATSQSPDDKRAGNVSDSEGDDSEKVDESGRRQSATGMNKRKAGQGRARRDLDMDEDDDGSGSDSATGHEDKRQHPNSKSTNGEGSGRRGGRKSGANEDGQPRGSKDQGKAARRKEQNRAAQKAFRERREAKVRDLEEKVAELEAKSYGANVENENLRGILKRLQEENVRLKQSAFTFSMPMGPGNATNSGATPPQQQTQKPPTPPQSLPDDSLRSINEPSPPLQAVHPPHRNSSGMSGNDESPESLVSVTDVLAQPQPPNLFGANKFNAAALGMMREADLFASNSALAGAASKSPTNSSSTGPTPSSSASNNPSEVEALWASFYPNGLGGPTPQQQASQNGQPPFAERPGMLGASAWGSAWNHSVPIAPGQNQSTPNVSNSMAYRDSSQAPAPAPAPAQAENPPQAKSAADPWADLASSNVEDFLASLVGNKDASGDDSLNLPANGDDEYFNSQIQAILAQNGSGNSPSAAFNLTPGVANAGPTFSPTNYINLSPSPYNSVSPQSSATGSGSGTSGKSNSNSPASSATYPTSVSGDVTCGSEPAAKGDALGNGVSTFGPPKDPAHMVHVVDEKGRIVRPSELWVKMGMQHENNIDSLIIDDLCDAMRSKATCKDGQLQLTVADAEAMFRYRGDNARGHLAHLEQRAGMPVGALSGAAACQNPDKP